MIAYFNGEFCPKEDVSISPDDRGFLLADGVYEVFCAYDGDLFATDAHFERLEQSLHAIDLTTPDGSLHKSITALPDVLPELLRRNDLSDAHAKIYLQVTRGAASRQHAFPDSPVPPTVYATAKHYDPPEQKWEEGVRAVLHPDLRWSRCDIKSVALLPAVLANQRAQEAGAFEAVLHREGVITEGSHTTVAAVVDDTLVTHPLTNHILPGVTRKVILNLCEHIGQPVQETPIRTEELHEVDELMVWGTTSGVMPVVQVDDWMVGTGEPGPVTRELQAAFRAHTDI